MKTYELRSVLIALAIFFSCLLYAHADIRFVSAAGSDEEPYVTPETASHAIQAAIDVSADGDEILVAPGRYRESIDFKGKNIKVLSLYAFCGDPAYIANTIVDGEKTNRVVAFHRHETPAAVLQGFTIANGWCPPPPDPADKITTSGAGILCDQSSPTLKNLIVVGNEAGNQGGGIFCFQSTSLVENVELIGNRAPLGGGVSAHHGATRFLNVKLQDNSAGSKGGAIYLYYADVQLRNVLVARNSATAKGGGLFLHYSNPNMENMTVVNNSTPAEGGGGMNLSYVSAPAVKNSIFWGNSQDQIAFDGEEGHMTLAVTYSDIQGGLAGVVTHDRGSISWGSDNLELYPLFAAGGHMLTSNSPCIDRGWNDDWMTTASDLAGNARIVNYLVDLGAYEYPDAIISPSNVVVSPPSMPWGPTTGTVGALLNYWVGGAGSSDGQPVAYLVDWGDGAFSGWSTATNYSHAWNVVGTYSVRARARVSSDTNVISAWSPSLEVTIEPVPHSPTTLYVSPDGLAKDGYTNWTIAATNIQAAIDVSFDGDEILVAPGVYQESINFLGKAITVQSLYSMSNDQAYIASTIIDGGGSNRVVIFNHGETASSVLRGFTITNGWGEGLGFLNVLGLYAADLYSPGGAGILCRFSSPTLQNLIITGNGTVDGDGGGIYFEESMSRVENVELIDNVGRFGGAIRIHWGTPSFLNVKFQGNNAVVGGALYLHNSNPQFRNVLVAQNNVEGLFLHESSPSLENVTVVDNAGPGMAWSIISHPVVKNSIFWGNSSSFSGPLSGSMGSTLTVSYSDIQGGQPAGEPPYLQWGPGNLELNPAFASPDYTLASVSACIDVGTNEVWMFLSKDLAGNSRMVNDIVDLGAYECLSGLPRVTVEPPEMPLGPTSGIVGERLTYDVSGASSSDGAPVAYLVDWGDGTLSGWSTSTNYAHAWNSAGSNSVRALARATSDTNVISSWSPSLEVTVVPVPHEPTTLYVSPDGTAENGYTNWTVASTSIQAAIDASFDGDEILAAPGVYRESISFQGKAITVQSLYSISNDRSCIANTIIDGGGTSRVATFDHGETAVAVLRGFTIANGWRPATGDGLTTCGGGILCDRSSPTLKNLIISGNEAGTDGGGIYLNMSTSRVENVDLMDNRALQGGGGGIHVHSGSPSILNVKLNRNRAWTGGGLLLYHCFDSQLRNLLIAQNSATVDGGGIYWSGYQFRPSPSLENATVVENTARAGGGGGMMMEDNSRFTVKNSIFWGNSQEQIVFFSDQGLPTLSVAHSVIQGGQIGIVDKANIRGFIEWVPGNLEVDPEFAAADYRLTTNSPCIDRGSNQNWMAVVMDLDGSHRIVNGVVDFGAYEYPEAVNPSNLIVNLYEAPRGPATGTVGQIMAYHVGGASSSDGQPLEYRMDWGDGVVSDWTVSTNFTHAWTHTGRYNVRTRARSIANSTAVSPWSPSLRVTAIASPYVPVTLYVSPDGASVDGYTNWTIAAKSIQAAIDESFDGDEILVAPGVYPESINFKGKAITVQSLYSLSNDSAYIVNTIIDGGGFRRVVAFDHGETAAAVLRGFTITNGWTPRMGGGMDGGGILCVQSSPILRDLIVSGNDAGGQGGGMYLGTSTSRVENVNLIGNRARYGGGGIYVYYGAPRFLNVKLQGNSASNGGAIWLIYSDAQLRNVLATQNNAENADGSISLFESSPSLENVTVVDNTAPGMRINYGSHPTVKNSIFWGNSQEQINVSQGDLSVSYSDIQDGLGGININEGTFYEGFVHWGPGNLGLDPAFASSDYTLTTGSPCIDRGSNEDWMTTATDLAGNNRVVNDIVDMGAYEYALQASAGVSPSIFSLSPPDGYVSTSNGVEMQMVVTDNVAVAGVTVNGEAASTSNSIHFSYTADGLWGAFNSMEIVARDALGNGATQRVNYAQCTNVMLYALWEGCWMVMNPFAIPLEYQWHSHDGTNGAGVAAAHSCSYFTTTVYCASIDFHCPGYLSGTRFASSLGGPPTSNVADLDSDGDGLSNGSEDTAGTDFNDGSSFFGMGAALLLNEESDPPLAQKIAGHSESQDRLTFSWQSAVGRLYTVEVSTDLSDWMEAPESKNIPGTGGAMMYTNTSVGQKMFMRMKAQKAR
ncbi:MAG TPA: hypothetical protein DCZ95_11710 [Verrucomicrobia bacterium]|nr:MAG: hypothetical protein A2X46_01715 [Lentisphaerae bacterium GWF2_57_35]HBA84751.1 hypothetical protein [Verrucomicrobiota bacterium]